MIIHVVLFHPRESLPDDERSRLLADITHAAAAIPSIRRFRIGQRVRHGLPGYEQAMREDYGFAAIIEFDDPGGLAAYLQHPAHQTIGAHFTISAQRALAYDYEVEDIPVSTEGDGVNGSTRRNEGNGERTEKTN